jgi:hypothetical protein
MALLSALLIMLVIAGSSWTFVWFMNLEQRRAGIRFRSSAALAAAESGVQRALAVLEGAATADDGAPGQVRALTGTLPLGSLEGQFRVAFQPDPDGAVVVTSAGEVAGISRAVRVRVVLGSPVLMAALWGASVVRLERPPAATVVLPYGAGIGDRPWFHIGAGQEIWFPTTEVSVNDPQVGLDVPAGPLEGVGVEAIALRPPPPGPVRLLLGPEAAITLARERSRVNLEELRVLGVRVEGTVLRAWRFPRPLDIDIDYFKRQAAANTANAAFNEAAGEYLRDADLRDKRDSLYSPIQIDQLLAYVAATGEPFVLQGVVYFGGGLALGENQHLRVVEGSLVVDGGVSLEQGASLQILHSPATRTLPGLIVVGSGGVVLRQQARLWVHGLVFSSEMINVGDGSRLDVVGAVLSNDPALSFRNLASTAVIRYDPAVLGTPGLRVPPGSPVFAWVARWEEIR